MKTAWSWIRRLRPRALHIALLGTLPLGCEGASGEPARIPDPEERSDGDERLGSADPPTAGSPRALAAPMTGVLIPENEIIVVASDFGRLEQLDVELGDHVSKGDVVARLDVRGDRSDLAAATAALKASAAELERLELELERAQQTRTDVEQLQAFVSKAEIRKERFAEKLAAARRRSAGASFREQRSRMKKAATRISEAELRAPFTGRVSQRFVDPGATLGAGEAIVELISDVQRVRFAVPEASSDALHEGASVEVRFAQDARAPARGVTLVGTVVAVAPEIEAGTRIILAEARLDPSPDDHAALRVGAVAEVRFR